MIRYAFTKSQNRIPKYPGPMLPWSARILLSKCGLASAAVLAYDGGRMVGFARILGHKASGTWVDPKYRRRGIATTMWQMLQQRTRKVTRVSVVSRAGRGFARCTWSNNTYVDDSLVY